VSRLAALLAGLAVTALVLGLMLQAANGSLPPLTDESWLLVPLGVGLPIVGAAIVRHQPRHPIGWILVGSGLGASLTKFTIEYAEYALVTKPGTAPLGVAAAWVSDWVWTTGAIPLLTWLAQARVCAALQPEPAAPVEDRATVRALRMTAQRVLQAHAEAEQLEKELRALVAAMAPVLLAQPGVGPVTAAQVLVSWSHPGRFRSEAAFAMLAGVAPIEASSGKVVRHRLNRGGDRQLNRALHTIVMIRQRYHRATKTYTTRRTGEGKSQREIRRCLKRTVGRQLFRLLERHAVAQVMA
jgi:Transposase IS116/IS110/IS902 family